MIRNLQNKKARINFENKSNQLIVPLGSQFKVFLNTIYNQDEYTMTLSHRLQIISVPSKYEYVFLANQIGFFTISLTSTNRTKTIDNRSNSLFVVVVQPPAS